MHKDHARFLKIDSVITKVLKWISFLSAVAMIVVAVIATWLASILFMVTPCGLLRFLSGDQWRMTPACDSVDRLL